MGNQGAIGDIMLIGNSVAMSATSKICLSWFPPSTKDSKTGWYGDNAGQTLL